MLHPVSGSSQSIRSDIRSQNGLWCRTPCWRCGGLSLRSCRAPSCAYRCSVRAPVLVLQRTSMSCAEGWCYAFRISSPVVVMPCGAGSAADARLQVRQHAVHDGRRPRCGKPGSRLAAPSGICAQAQVGTVCASPYYEAQCILQRCRAGRTCNGDGHRRMKSYACDAAGDERRSGRQPAQQT